MQAPADPQGATVSGAWGSENLGMAVDVGFWIWIRVGKFVSFVMAVTERCLSRSAMERDLSLDQAGNRVS